MNSSAEYVVNWTMPHCVLCLRLIAVAIDVYDGNLPEVKDFKNIIYCSFPKYNKKVPINLYKFFADIDLGKMEQRSKRKCAHRSA